MTDEHPPSYKELNVSVRLHDEVGRYRVHVRPDGREMKNPLLSEGMPVLFVQLFRTSEGLIERTATLNRPDPDCGWMQHIRPPGADWRYAGRPDGDSAYWRRFYSADHYDSGDSNER